MKGVLSNEEWEFVVAPVVDGSKTYNERAGDFREQCPDWCRKPLPLDPYLAKMRGMVLRVMKRVRFDHMWRVDNEWYAARASPPHVRLVRRSGHSICNGG